MNQVKDINEYSLIKKCQQGDKQAYGVLVKKNMKRAYFTALGLTGYHESALDMSQEAFVRAYRSITKFDTKQKFFTWYYQILRNLCFNHNRNRNRRARPFSDIGDIRLNRIVDRTQSVIDKIDLQEMKNLLWQAIDSLKSQEKEIIVLKDFQDMSYKEIAEFLHIPIGTVMSRLFTARKTLKEKLRGWDKSC